MVFLVERASGYREKLRQSILTEGEAVDTTTACHGTFSPFEHLRQQYDCLLGRHIGN
ncbi:uncharacterized protein BYT42DRAFT_577449 [Radiomyces spectabilis]|uniref:uncharacterized protein n=1 Tax=Radiomyces spectabilis TaxID=64574 RepID=UPI002220C51A|nr:uncharacterized protein BYT42DRAFT_577449 [Radiomyces spectabilis]KAI8374734.1 hypothetical protein BYT42DRAFT_577449 [Radiomyces spectabilis]